LRESSNISTQGCVIRCVPSASVFQWAMAGG
jgi:hypothetical protein